MVLMVLLLMMMEIVLLDQQEQVPEIIPILIIMQFMYPHYMMIHI